MTPKEINEAIHEVIELQTHQPDWWIKRQARYLAKRLEELPVGQSLIISNALALALEEDDIKEVLGQFPEGTFKVFARFGGCEIIKQKVKQES